MMSSRFSALAATLLCGVLLIVQSAAHAQAQWKWRDARGQVQYSDTPPPAGTPESSVLQRPRATAAPVVVAAPAQAAEPDAAASAASAPSVAASAVDPALEARRKQAEQAEAAKRKAEEASTAPMRATNCDRARGYLRALDGGQRVARTLPNGEREVLDDAARARESAQARQAVLTNCR